MNSNALNEERKHAPEEEDEDEDDDNDQQPLLQIPVPHRSPMNPHCVRVFYEMQEDYISTPVWLEFAIGDQLHRIQREEYSEEQLRGRATFRDIAPNVENGDAWELSSIKSVVDANSKIVGFEFTFKEPGIDVDTEPYPMLSKWIRAAAIALSMLLFFVVGHILGLLSAQRIEYIAEYHTGCVDHNAYDYVDGEFANMFKVTSYVALSVLCCVWAVLVLALVKRNDKRCLYALLCAFVAYVVVYLAWWLLLIQILLFSFYIFEENWCTENVDGFKAEIYTVCGQCIGAMAMFLPEIVMAFVCWFIGRKAVGL